MEPKEGNYDQKVGKKSATQVDIDRLAQWVKEFYMAKAGNGEEALMEATKGLETELDNYGITKPEFEMSGVKPREDIMQTREDIVQLLRKRGIEINESETAE